MSLQLGDGPGFHQGSTKLVTMTDFLDMTRKEKLESEIRYKDSEVSELKKMLDDEAVASATSEFSHHWTYDVEQQGVHNRNVPQMWEALPQPLRHT